MVAQCHEDTQGRKPECDHLDVLAGFLRCLPVDTKPPQPEVTEIAQRCDNQAKENRHPQRLWQVVANSMYSPSAEVLRDDRRTGKHDAQHNKVKRQPNVEADGNCSEILITETCRHNRIDNTGSHLCALGDQQWPTDAPKMRQF